MANVLVSDFFGESGYLLRAILHGLGHTPHLARSIEGALRVLDETPIEAVLVDLQTPVATHLDLIENAMVANSGALPMLAVLGRRQRFRSDVRLRQFPRGHFAAVIRPPLWASKVEAAVANALAATKPEANRRTAKRHSLDVGVSMQVGHSVVPCRTLDVSDHGAALLPMVGESAQEIMLNKIEQAVREKSPLQIWVEPIKRATSPQKIEVAFVGSRRLGRGAQHIWRVRFTGEATNVQGLRTAA